LWNPRNSPISSRNCPHSQPLQLNSLPVDRFCFQANPVDWVPREFSRHSLGCSVSWRVGGLEGPVSTYLSIKHWILPHGGDRGPQNPMSDGEIRLQAVGGHWKAFKDLPSTLDFPVSHSSRASAPGKSGVEGRVLHPGWPTGQVFSLQDSLSSWKDDSSQGEPRVFQEGESKERKTSTKGRPICQ